MARFSAELPVVWEIFHNLLGIWSKFEVWQDISEIMLALGIDRNKSVTHHNLKTNVARRQRNEGYQLILVIVAYS